MSWPLTTPSAGAAKWSVVKLLFKLLPQQQAEMERGRGLLRQLFNLVSHAVVVKIGVRHIVVRGTLRLTLAPLLGDLPVVGAARNSMLGMTEFSYETSLYGGNPFVVPGLEAWINSFVRSKALSPFLFPGSLLLPIPGAPQASARGQEPEGLLEVRVLQAANLPRMNWLAGKADPFVRVWVRETSRFSTSVKSRTLNPTWDESFTLIVHSTAYQSLTLVVYDSDTLLPDEEIGRVEVPLSNMDLSPGSLNDLWLPIVPPQKQQWEQQRQPTSPGGQQRGALGRGVSGGGGCSMQASVGQGADAGVGASGVAPCRTDTAHGWSSLLRRSHRGASQPPSPPAVLPAGRPQLQRRSMSLERLATRLSRGGGGDKHCQLHVQCGFSAFTRQEVAAAMAAGQPGIVNILRRLSRESWVPSLLRSGVLTILLEKAEGLGSRTEAGFTRNYKVRISVGAGITRVTERGKVALRHKRDPVFDERLELLVDGETAGNEATQIVLEIYSSHFLRRDKFKGRAVVPLREVQRRRRRGSWPLQDAPSGTLLMELSWTAAAGMY